jgi:hypothetical protein
VKAWIILEYDLSEDGDTETLKHIAKKLEEWIEEDGTPVPAQVYVRDQLELSE